MSRFRRTLRRATRVAGVAMILALASAGVLWATAPHVITVHDRDRIKDGMTLQEAEDAVGRRADVYETLEAFIAVGNKRLSPEARERLAGKTIARWHFPECIFFVDFIDGRVVNVEAAPVETGFLDQVGRRLQRSRSARAFNRAVWSGPHAAA